MDLLSILALTMPFVLGAGLAESLKLNNRQLRILLIFLIAALCFVGEYFSYELIGFPPWMRWIAGDRVTAATRFESASPTAGAIPAAALATREAQPVADIDSLYKADETGWMKKKTPDGYVYQCVPCQNQVEVAILFGDELDADAINKYKSIEAQLSDAKFAKEWITQTIQSKIPVKDAEIDIERTEVGVFFNITMVEYEATVDLMKITSHETGFFGLHKSRFVNVTLNYLDGSMDEIANKAITHLFSNLQFVDASASPSTKR